jgi:hypothetical protein
MDFLMLTGPARGRFHRRAGVGATALEQGAASTPDQLDTYTIILLLCVVVSV